MKQHQASRTAEYMAFFRALESIRPNGLFADPFAANFLRPSLRRAVQCSRVPVLLELITRYADRRLPGARTSAVARTKLIDDVLLGALGRDMRQIVILGAGFDCRAYRFPQLAAATIFEVDHPSTLALKLNGLRKALPEIPGNVRFVKIDFNQQSLPEELMRAGFNLSSPAMFLWEGVTNYLTPDAVDAVLRYVATCQAGTQIVFTYIHSGALDGAVFFEGAERLLRDVAQLEEPWTFGLHPARVPEFLRERGLSLEFDLSADEYRSRYFGRVAERMRGYGFYHVAVARVSGLSEAVGKPTV